MNPQTNDDLLNPTKILKTDFGINAGEQVADLGCGGAAHFTIEAAKIVTNTGQIHAVDVLKKALTAVEGRAKVDELHNIKTYWSDLEKYGALKINDESMDKVMLVNMLFQSTGKELVIKEASRLIKPKGKLLVIDWLPGRFFIGPPAEEKIDKEKVEEYATNLKLKKIHEFNPGKYHFGLIFQK